MRWLAWPLPAIEGQGQLQGGSHGWWALRFTPCVARLEEGLLLEVSSTERLWGGIEAMRAALARAAREDGMGGADVCAEASTALQALALLRLQMAGRPIPARLPDGLPLAALSALRPHLQPLRQLGCRCWGDVRGLPRAGLARRFGAGLLLALDQAYGECAHRLPWLELPERFERALELPQSVQAAPQLLQAAQHLLRDLRNWLAARHQGVLALELCWRHDLRRVDGVDLEPWGSIELRTAEAVQGTEHLRRLLAERLAWAALAAPVNALRLRSLETADMRQSHASLLPPGPGNGKNGADEAGEPWHQFVERVNARLGAGAVQVASLREDHRPEAMQQWRDCAGPPACLAGRTAAPPPSRARHALWPGWLLRPPRALSMHQHRPWLHGQPLSLLAGPERIEGGWWPRADGADGADEEGAEGPALRDYFVAHNEAAGWVWVFRDQPTGRWFLHGVYG